MKKLTNALSTLQVPDRPAHEDTAQSPFIAVIYGFAAREHMQRNLLRALRKAGYTNTTMYGHLQEQLIVSDLEAAAAKGQKVVIIGYSQGGLESIRVANELNKRNVSVALLATIAGGGGGRLWPHRWSDDPRTIPANVDRCLNYFSATDFLGTDHPLEKNLAIPQGNETHVENITFSKEDRVSHLAITTCYPESKAHPRVKTELWQRIRNELSAL